MAMETLVVGKCGNASTPVELIKGDNYTQKIMMRVPRYFGGVDLAPLAWSVTVENAAGATDEYALSAIRGEDAIEMEWIPGGTATAVPGIVKFKLSGYAQDGSDVLIWQSGTYHIRVKDTFSHTPGSETETALSEVQELILYVNTQLPGVLQAGTDAAAAAASANTAAADANAATAQAVPAAEAANTAATSATNAAGSANTAATRANTVADEISAMFCEVGEYFKVDLLSKFNMYQGGINFDFSINTRTDRVAYKVPLEKNKVYYLFFEPFVIVDCVAVKVGYTNIEPVITVKGITITTDGVDRDLLVSLRREDNSELLVSEQLLNDCHLYEMVEKAKISTDGMLQQGYFSFTNKTYVDSAARACMQCDLEPGKVYSVVAPNNVVLREIALYKNENEVYSLFTAAALKRAVVRVSEYEPDKNKMQIIFSRKDPNAAIGVEDCEKVEFAEVY